METIGNCLKKEREANNISLKEVARITKITQIYLEYIEKNEFDKLPQGPYIKSYLSSYSRAIGCDVDRIINLYESANHKQVQDEGIKPAAASMGCGKNLVAKPEAKRRRQPRNHRLGNLRLWLNTLVSFVIAKVASFRAAKKPIDTPESSQPHNILSLRHRPERSKLFGLGMAIIRGSTDRRNWLYACISLLGACTLFLAGVGFYHLFFYEPDSVSIAEAEKNQDKGASLTSSVVSQPSVLPVPPTDATQAADTPKNLGPKNQLIEPTKSDTVVSESKPEIDILPDTSEPAKKFGVYPSDSFSTKQQTALPRDNAAVKSPVTTERQSIKDAPSSKPTVVDASLRITEAVICRAIENRMPAGVDRSFLTSDGKVYVWTKIEAKQFPSKVHHIYYFGGEKISDVSLNVRSTPWRTWSSKTIANPGYRGEWRVDIATSDGEILRSLYFEVK